MAGRRLFLAAAVAAVTGFIWYHSLQDARVSTGYSGFFVQLLQPLLSLADGLSWGDMDHAVRKAAHFTEFAGLGFFLRLLAGTVRQARVHVWGAALFAGLLVAMTDEFLQRFSPGRSSQWSDVALDFAGVCCGCLLAAAARRLAGARNRGNGLNPWEGEGGGT